MLNEAWRLWRALDAAEISVEPQHPLIEPVREPVKSLLRVRLNHAGNVVGVEDVAEDERLGLRRIGRTSQGTYPVLLQNKPFKDVPASDPLWEQLRKAKARQERLQLLKTAIDRPSRSWKKAGWRWEKQLDVAALLEEQLNNENARPMRELSRRFKKALATENEFFDGVFVQALACLEQNFENIDVVQTSLIGKGKTPLGKDKKMTVRLVLDLDVQGASGVYQKSTWCHVAEVLPTNLAEREEHEHAASDSAFGGEGELLAEPFPGVMLPVLNSIFSLISMHSDGGAAKCNERYGLTEYIVTPIYKWQSLRIQDALAWIVSDGQHGSVNREGETWRGVANGRFVRKDGRTDEQQDLLIAFVEDKPNVDAKLTKYVGSGREVIKPKFEEDAKAIADAFNADPQVRPNSKLHFFLIHKISNGQAQVALAESPTVEEVVTRAEQWVNSVKKNVPQVRLCLKEESKDGEMKCALPGGVFPPYPDQVVRLLSYQWVRDGSSPKGGGGEPQKPYHEVVGPGVGEVLNLMLRIEGKWKPAALRLLMLLIQRLSPLLIGAFGAKHAYGPRQARNKHEPLFDYPRTSREAALRAVAVIGVLLDALGQRKEQYMNNGPFQVGQVLALADTLHKDYCTVVRKGQLPNSLIGTALMRRALDNPAAAVAGLGERMIEYVRWAKTVDVPEGIFKTGSDGKQVETEESRRKRLPYLQAKKTLLRYESLSDKLGPTNLPTLPTEANDIEKAQLLLGFLASPPADSHQNGKDGNE